MLDRHLRAKVVAANAADADLRAVHVEGIGHEFWADADAGFTAAGQDDLIGFLLAFPARSP